MYWTDLGLRTFEWDSTLKSIPSGNKKRRVRLDIERIRNGVLISVVALR
jgi:hypothetical protein